LALALVIGLAGSARAFYGEVQGWVTSYLNPDFFVSGSPTLTDRTYRFPDSMAAELESISGIADVQRVRHPRVEVDGTPIVLVATELAKMIRRSRLTVVDGDRDRMLRLAMAGEGVIASESFATMHAVRVGQSIELPTPSGALRLPLVGIIKDYADQQGSLIIDRALFVNRWRDDTVDFFRVYLAAGAAPEPVKAAILSRFAGNRRVFVLTNADLRDYVTGLTDQWFRMTWIQVAIAILVAVLGIVNSLTVSITDRRRELGVLRALGGHANQVRWAIGMEAIGIALVSVVLGLALGAVHLYFVLQLAARDFFGIRLEYLYPYGMAAALFPMILTTAVLGAWGPAEAAVRASLVEALEYE
jgi:putative ABC transport system permease protein